MTSGGQNSNWYLIVAYFFNTSVNSTSVRDLYSLFPALVSNTFCLIVWISKLHLLQTHWSKFDSKFEVVFNYFFCQKRVPFCAEIMSPQLALSTLANMTQIEHDHICNCVASPKASKLRKGGIFVCWNSRRYCLKNYEP